MEDQHPDHFFRVNRWTTHGQIKGREDRTDREQCRSSAPDDLRGPHRQDETRSLNSLPWSLSRRSLMESTPPRFASTERNHGSPRLSTDFCNKIGTKRKWRTDLRLSGEERKSNFGVVRSVDDPEAVIMESTFEDVSRGDGATAAIYRRRRIHPDSRRCAL